MGGKTEIVCDITGVIIDPENSDLNEMSAGICPLRAPRCAVVF
jgi:hypothetical protein